VSSGISRWLLIEVKHFCIHKIEGECVVSPSISTIDLALVVESSEGIQNW